MPVVFVCSKSIPAPIKRSGDAFAARNTVWLRHPDDPPVSDRKQRQDIHRRYLPSTQQRLRCRSRSEWCKKKQSTIRCIPGAGPYRISSPAGPQSKPRNRTGTRLYHDLSSPRRKGNRLSAGPVPGIPSGTGPWQSENIGFEAISKHNVESNHTMKISDHCDTGINPILYFCKETVKCRFPPDDRTFSRGCRRDPVPIP